jgi:hypothetical protein
MPYFCRKLSKIHDGMKVSTRLHNLVEEQPTELNSIGFEDTPCYRNIFEGGLS